jgi:tetratricopeptide (TPR) repeat protein
LHFKWIIYLTLCSFLGVILSCAGINPAFPTENDQSEWFAPSDEEMIDRKEETLRESYTNFAMASMLMKQGRPVEAKDYLAKTLEQDPDSVYLNQRMALLLKDLKDYKTAAEYARKSIELDPDDMEGRIIIAEIYESLGDQESAVREYEKILEADPDQQRARITVASIYIREGQYDFALMHLDRLIEQDPRLLMAHYYRGRIHLELGNYVEAEKSYLDVLKLEDRMEPALFDLGTLYEQSPDTLEKAVEVYQRLLSFNPDNLLLRGRLLEVYYRLHQEEMAQDQVDVIKQQSRPGDPVRRILGLAYLRHGKPVEAISELAPVVSFWPGDHEARYYLAAAYEENKEWEKALHHYKMINETSRHFVNTQIRIAYILEKQERYDEAIERMRRVLEKDPNHVDALNYIGYTYAQQGLRLDEAMTLIKKALELAPESGHITDSLGWVYYQQGLYDEALESLQKAFSLEPDEPEIIEHLGDAYFKKAQYEESLDMYQKALSLDHGDKERLKQKIEETRKYIK